LWVAGRLEGKTGSFASKSRCRRNALKLWTGWPTFPMVFVKGVLVGGFDDLKTLHDSGERQSMLARTRTPQA
jgi:monothiol glutaredoxin